MPGCLLLFLLLLVTSFPGRAQIGNTMYGYSGLLLTPTAQIHQDGELAFGISRIPLLYAPNYHGGSYDRTVLFASMGFLPFLEGTFGFVRPDNMQGGVGDRTMTARLRLWRQNGWRPALALGMQDFFAIEELELEPVSSQHFASTYAVLSHEIPVSHPLVHQVSAHLGYGTDWLPSNDRHLNGWFGGVRWAPVPQFELMLEYDSQSINSGIRFFLCSRVQYMFAFWQHRYVMHHLSFSFLL